MTHVSKPRFVYDPIECADFDQIEVTPLLTCDTVLTALRGHRCDILLLLALVGPLCVYEIAERLRLCKSVASRALRRLRRHNLVRYDRDHNSRRFELGEAICGRSRAGWAQLGIQLPNCDWLLLKCREPRPASPTPPGQNGHEPSDHAVAGPQPYTPNEPWMPGTAIRVAWDEVLFLLSGHRYEILTLVALQGQMRSGEIVRRLGVNATSVSRELKDLRVAQLLDHAGKPNRHRYQLGRCVHADVTPGYVRLIVRTLDGSWMLMHREEFNDSDRSIPMPTDWLEDPVMLLGDASDSA